MQPQAIPLSSIRLDGGTQPRVELSEDVVAEYAEKMASGEKMPPLIVFHDGSHYWLADGFHRLLAAKRNEAKTVVCDVQTGTKRDAILYAVGANAQHGLPRTNADKRNAVMTMLTNELVSCDAQGKPWSDREIARRCAVGHPFVGRVRASLVPETSEKSERAYITKHGTVSTMHTENIGKRGKSWDEFTESSSAAPSTPITAPIPSRKPAGVGIGCAHEAINALKRIPINDPLRDEGFQMVAEWIDFNIGRKAA